jgi:SAM-dependent methyltransferase
MGLLKIPFMLVAISYLRFIYFFNLKKKFKIFLSKENKVIIKNTGHINLKFYQISKIYNFYSPKRKLSHFYPLRALNFLRPLDMKVLSIGPRNESELFTLVTLGFQLKNISALDLQSYSNLITLGDAINMPFEKNSFDLVIIGKMLVYTNEPDKVIRETIRVLKDNGIVSMYHSHSKDKRFLDYNLDSSKIILDLFGNNLNDIYFKYHTFDKNKELDRGISNILVSVKK